MTIKILRLACTFSPESSISIEYTDNSDLKQYRRFPVFFGSFSSPEALYQTLIDDYPDYFNKDSILPNKLKNFVSIIIKKAPTVDLTNVSKDQLVKYKNQMEREFEMNAIKPGDPNFVYDMRVDLPEPDEACDWDD